MIELALHLLTLHAVDGSVVSVNPEAITSKRQARDDATGKHFTANAHCMISLADGKYVTVIEDCSVVKHQLEQE